MAKERGLKAREDKMRMTEGSIWKILVRFAFPLLLGNLFQQLYNVADTFVVGNFCGDEALAAVASSGNLCHLMIGFFQGMFLGASVIISRYYGAKDEEGVDRALHTTVIFALGLGALLSLVGVLFTPTILRWMGTPENVLPHSVLYFRIYCGGLLSLVLYNTSNGIFQALGDSRRPLFYLIISSITNVILDLLFVGLLDLGVGGAALATVLSQCLSAGLGMYYLMSGKFVVQICRSKLRVHLPTLKRVVVQGLPSGVQNSMIGIANVVMQSNINAFGDQAMAGCGSYSKIEGFAFLPIMSLTMAMTTFISQNLGAGRNDRARAGAKIGTVMAVATAELIGIGFFCFAPQLVGLFSDTPEVVAYGVRQAHVEGFFYFFLAFAHSAGAILRGAERPMIPMGVMLSTWCLLRICYVTVMARLLQDIVAVYTAFPVTWGASCILFVWFLKRSNWANDGPNYHHM